MKRKQTGEPAKKKWLSIQIVHSTRIGEERTENGEKKRKKGQCAWISHFNMARR